VRGHGSEPIETLGCRKDGSCFPLELEMSRMPVDEGASIIVCIRDISGRKAYTEALEQ
jgi:PAS domain S-box-containing protein